MKRVYTVFAAFICSFAASAGPIPLFQNYGVITNAIPIDAVAFDNRGTFDINSELPYDMQDVVNFTNLNLMISSGGFRFDTITNNFRQPANNFVNSGAIMSDGFFGSFAFGGIGGLVPNGLAGISQSSYILVNATNIDGSNGSFEVTSPGLLRLKGRNTDLNRAALIAGDPFSGTGGGFGGYVRIAGTNYYLLPSDINEIYGGAGVQTNTLLTSFGDLIPPDSVSSPSHRVFFPGGSTNGTFVSLPNDFLAQFEGVANVSAVGNQKLVQAVFVNTNFTDPNISAQVTFSPSFFGAVNPNVVNQSAPAVVVQFTSSSYDPITGGIASNTVSFIDTSAMQTNLVMFTNFNARSNVKPSSYEVTTANIGSFGEEGNTPYTPELLYDPAVHASNRVVGFYGGYGVSVGSESSSTVNAEVNPTNRSPRIEIESDNLDLTLTRMRSEGPILLKTKHLVSDEGADISAGLMQADIGSTNGFLQIANLFPTNFQRLAGDIYGYSFIWENTETDPDTGETNDVRFHVLIVDQAFTANIRPSIDTLILRSTNVVLENDVKLDRVARFEAQNLTVNSLLEITNFNLAATNFVGLKNFVLGQNGILTGANDVKIGFDTPNGLDSIVNLGQINAVAALFKAGSFFNSGFIQPGTNNIGIAGSIAIQARDATLAGGTLEAGQLIEISAGDLVVTNTTIIAGGLDAFGTQLYGRLVLNVTNLITDFGVGANNFWEVSNGFELSRKPFSGDLLGTEIRTIASGTRLITHRWAGEDVGGGPDGFINNVTLGRLVLDIRSSRSKLRFTGTGFQNALYVRTLDFELAPDIDINTDLNTLLQIDPNFRIYFINSNAGDKLVTAFPDRVIQVPDFGVGAILAPLSVSVNGFGIVTPNLDGKLLKVGDTYQVRARAGKGQMFKKWSGGAESSNPVLTFEMSRNLVLRADMVPNPFDDSANPVQGTYNGLFSEETGVRHESSGFINLKLSKSGAFTGKIISGKTFPFRGVFDSTGHAQVPVRRARQSNLTLDLQVDLTDRSGQITGTVSGENWIAKLIADREVGLDSEINPGKYTVVIPGGEAPAPLGDGIGTAQLDSRGGLHFVATLADGSRVNQKVNVSRNGHWPFYSALYAGKGSAFGWLSFTNLNQTSVQGDVSWIKKAAPGRNYQAGFTNSSSVIASPYSASAPALQGTTGTFVLNGGTLSGAVTNEVNVDSNSFSNSAGVQLRVNGPTGLLSGTFVHPETSKVIRVQGVVLQLQNSARGFFLDGDQSGSLLLQGN